jgi:hypothetical protein
MTINQQLKYKKTTKPVNFDRMDSVMDLASTAQAICTTDLANAPLSNQSGRNRPKAILAGTAPGFSSPGNDTFAGTNVLSVVVEVPKTLIGATGNINVWLETKKKI